MVIDLILDRKAGKQYNAHDFYMDCMGYGKIAFKITEAMDYGTNEDVQKALAYYILDNGYNTKIIDYIYSVKWLDNEE